MHAIINKKPTIKAVINDNASIALLSSANCSKINSNQDHCKDNKA